MKKWLSTAKTRMIYIGRMFRILWDNDRKFLFCILFDTLISAVIPFFGMYLAKYSINMLSQGEAYSKYVSIIALLLGMSIVVSLVQSVVSTKSGVMGNMIGDKLFRVIFNKTMDLDYEMLLDKDILEKRELAMKVIEQGRFNNLAGNFKQFFTNIIVVAGIIYIISSIEFWIIMMVIAIIIVNSYSTSIRKKSERTVHVESIPVGRKIEYFWEINSDFAYGKEIRTYNMKSALNNIHQGMVETIQIYVRKIFGLQFKSNFIFLITNFCLNSLIYLYLGYKILVLHSITIGDFSLYLGAITTFNAAVQTMVSSYIDISNNGQYLKDYFDFTEIPCKTDVRALPPQKESSYVFEFKNVSFKYPYQKNQTLKHVNLVIHDKERLSIVGENGAGKTTLIKLLLRLYEPSQGRILLNGTDIKEIDYKDYLNIFSTVFQDFKLFAFKITDNITALNHSADADVRTDESLKKAGIYDKVMSLPKGKETYLFKLYEEDGVELSGGEAQKMAIARAIYKDSPIVVLDEPTAALDPRAEYEIYSKFLNMVQDKTAIFVSHRLSSTRFCDRIIVLRNGEIEEAGSHDELIKKNGYYFELYNMQAQYYL